MKYDPQNDSNILEPGQYSAVIISAEEKQSKAGNDMVEVILEVSTPDGPTKQVWDYLMEPYGITRVKQLKRILGEDPKDGELDVGMLVDLNVTVELTMKSGSGTYDDRNMVKRYLPSSSARSAPATVTETQDDIPF